MGHAGGPNISCTVPGRGRARELAHNASARTLGAPASWGHWWIDSPNGQGYRAVSDVGAERGFSDAVTFGDMSMAALNRDVVGVTSTADGRG